MRTLTMILVLLPALLHGGITAKHHVMLNPQQRNFTRDGELIQIEVLKNKKVYHYTILDTEFGALTGGKAVNVHKSVTAAYLEAAKEGKRIKVSKNGSTTTCDPEKETSHSIIRLLETAAKNGYRRTGNE